MNVRCSFRGARRWIVLMTLVVACSTSGCVMKGEHLKITGALKKQIAGLQKDKDGLQSQLDQRNRDYQSMKAAHDKQVASRKTVEKQFAELTEEHKTCNKRVRDLNNRVTDLTQARGSLGKRLQKAFSRIDELKKLAQKRKALFDKLRNSFKALVSAGKLKIRMVKGMFVLQLAEKILFSSGSSNVKKAGRVAIKEVTEILRAMNRRWQVTGHTDSRGNARFNWSLSVRRAQAVLFVMLRNGMPPSQISAAGFGQFQPTAPNDTNENRALNRRTEIVLVPNLEELKLSKGPTMTQVCRAIARDAKKLDASRPKG